MRKVFTLPLLFFVLLLQGCGQLAYYTQSIGGQLEIWDKQRPVDEVINTTADATLKAQLQLSQQIRDFASAELGLPDNNSYRKYADLGRDYVLWNVFAAPEFSTEALTSCFLIVGCISYQGYFHKEEAQARRDSLRAIGFDEDMGGVSAYSTIGYFNDPLLNTFIDYPETALAALLFHELAHQVVYIEDDTVFNESFATAVQNAGTRRWLYVRNKPGLFQQYTLNQQRDAQVIQLILAYRKKLQQMYDRPDLNDKHKRARKQTLFAELKQAYHRLKAPWGEYRRYDGFFSKPLNNASLVPIGTYYDKVPAFEKLLQNLNGDLTAFYKEVKRIGDLPPTQREQYFKQLQ